MTQHRRKHPHRFFFVLIVEYDDVVELIIEWKEQKALKNFDDIDFVLKHVSI